MSLDVHTIKSHHSTPWNLEFGSSIDGFVSGKFSHQPTQTEALLHTSRLNNRYISADVRTFYLNNPGRDFGGHDNAIR